MAPRQKIIARLMAITVVFYLAQTPFENLVLEKSEASISFEGRDFLGESVYDRVRGG